MKFSVERGLLFAALGKARGIIEARNTIPILSHVRIIATADSKLAIRGSDLDNQVDTIIDADVAESGGAAISAILIYDMTKSMPKSAVISFESQPTGEVQVKSGRAKFKLLSLPIADYPQIEEGSFSHRFMVDRADLDDLFGKTQFAISTDETRYYLQGTYFHAIGDELRACATDGHRMALVSKEAPEGAKGFTGIIIPSKTISSAISMMAGKETVEISLSSGKVRFDFGDTVLLSKVIDGTFPDYQRVIPTMNDKRLVVDREALIAGVSRCSAVAMDRSKAIKLEMSAEEGLVISMSSPDHGSAREEIDATFDGPPAFAIGFNARYLIGVAEHFSSDSLIFSLGDPGSPTLVAERDGIVDKTIIMPMRV